MRPRRLDRGPACHPIVAPPFFHCSLLSRPSHSRPRHRRRAIIRHSARMRLRPTFPRPTASRAGPTRVPCACGRLRFSSFDKRSATRPHRHPRALPFSPQQFQALFTLSSKSFSSFPHGTFALSVSRRYLAFDGVYHLLGVAIPNNSTLRTPPVRCRDRRATDGVLTLYDTLFQRIYTRPTAGTASPDYNSGLAQRTDFHTELFPLHSPLLRESLLVSFPPLIDMLKFGGSSGLR